MIVILIYRPYRAQKSCLPKGYRHMLPPGDRKNKIFFLQRQVIKSRERTQLLMMIICIIGVPAKIHRIFNSVLAP